MSTPLTILVPAMFNGPPGSANGGISAGLAASQIDGPAEVSLRAPPPLDIAMEVVPTGDGYEVRHGDQLVMTAQPAAPLAPPPAAPSFETAQTGPDSFPPVETHAFPRCYVCGPERSDDGLCLFTGKPNGYDGVTDVWTPDESLAGEDGLVRPRSTVRAPLRLAFRTIRWCWPASPRRCMHAPPPATISLWLAGLSMMTVASMALPPHCSRATASCWLSRSNCGSN